MAKKAKALAAAKELLAINSNNAGGTLAYREGSDKLSKLLAMLPTELSAERSHAQRLLTAMDIQFVAKTPGSWRPFVACVIQALNPKEDVLEYASVVAKVRLDSEALSLAEKLAGTSTEGKKKTLDRKRSLPLEPKQQKNAKLESIQQVAECGALSSQNSSSLGPDLELATTKIETENNQETALETDEKAATGLKPEMRSGLDCHDLEHLDYKPLSTMIDKPPAGELKDCSSFVTEDCKSCMPEAELLDEMVIEASKITTSKLSNKAVKSFLDECKVTGSMLFAIVVYTFDLCLLDHTKPRTSNFYFVLNHYLRLRSAEFLVKAHGYLYYLMTGLSRLPSWEGAILYRGIDATGAARARKEYADGRLCHWSGFSSATPSLIPSKQYAEQSGPGGIILRIRLLKVHSRCRDIQKISAFPTEMEILLLPNFKTMVTQEATYEPDIGLDVIDLKEQKDVATDVF